MNTVDIMRAADYAARRHSAHRRKGVAQEPYVNHVLEVAYLLAQATDGADAALVIAGLLHDTVEDAEVTPEELEREFGADVRALVLEVTDDKSLPKAERKLMQIEHAAHASNRAKMIKLADKTANLRSIQESPDPTWSHERKVQYLEWAAQVVAGCRGVNSLLESGFDRAFSEASAAIHADS